MRPPGCSDGSLEVAEPLAGTSPHAAAWVALEQDGPWGPRALTDSHLDPEVGRRLDESAGHHGVRPSLVRRPGRHADHPEGRRVLVAYTYPGRNWLLEGCVDDPAALLGLDFAGLTAGDEQAVRRSLPSLHPAGRPQLLVCTNGRRDACCAGRRCSTAAEAARRGHLPDRQRSSPCGSGTRCWGSTTSTW